MEDHAPEQIPGDLPPGMTLATAPGNNVIVDLGNRRFALYAHFQLTSIQVKVGDRIHKGDILGKLGNSGNTTNPHLHLQIVDRPSFGSGEALPLMIDDLKSSGTVTDIRPLFDGKAAILGSRLAGPHLHQLPLNNSIVNFN